MGRMFLPNGETVPKKKRETIERKTRLCLFFPLSHHHRYPSSSCGYTVKAVLVTIFFLFSDLLDGLDLVIGPLHIFQSSSILISLPTCLFLPIWTWSLGEKKKRRAQPHVGHLVTMCQYDPADILRHFWGVDGVMDRPTRSRGSKSE